jgi:hypothetical protein
MLCHGKKPSCNCTVDGVYRLVKLWPEWLGKLGGKTVLEPLNKNTFRESVRSPITSMIHRDLEASAVLRSGLVTDGSE